MKLEDMKNQEDVLCYMNENINYGWIDIDGNIHRREIKILEANRTSFIEECLQHGLGTYLQ